MLSNKVVISIGGDTVPTESNEQYLIRGEARFVFNGIKDIFESSDLVIVNLECPLTNNEKDIKKVGPCLKAKPETVEGLVKSGINVFSLANNHIMDFGGEGLADTIKQIVDRQMFFVGAGEDLKSARNILIFEKNGCKIALISVAEHEYSIAEEDTPGANPFDPFDIVEDIKKAKDGATVVIVLYHGGIEHYQLPSPRLQRICRKMVENGADYVICQHSHCIGSYENYFDKHIIYGQGNLLFDFGDNKLWQTGLIIRITIEQSKSNIEFLPIVKRGYSIDLAVKDEKDKILREFLERNHHVSDEDYIKAEWVKFCNKRKYRYFQTLLGFGKLLKRIDNKLGNLLTRGLVGRNGNILLLHDFLVCESHLELMRAILQRSSQFSKKNK